MEPEKFQAENFKAYEYGAVEYGDADAPVRSTTDWPLTSTKPSRIQDHFYPRRQPRVPNWKAPPTVIKPSIAKRLKDLVDVKKRGKVKEVQVEVEVFEINR